MLQAGCNVETQRRGWKVTWACAEDGTLTPHPARLGLGEGADVRVVRTTLSPLNEREWAECKRRVGFVAQAQSDLAAVRCPAAALPTLVATAAAARQTAGWTVHRAPLRACW